MRQTHNLQVYLLRVKTTRRDKDIMLIIYYPDLQMDTYVQNIFIGYYFTQKNRQVTFALHLINYLTLHLICKNDRRKLYINQFSDNHFIYSSMIRITTKFVIDLTDPIQYITLLVLIILAALGTMQTFRSAICYDSQNLEVLLVAYVGSENRTQSKDKINIIN